MLDFRKKMIKRVILYVCNGNGGGKLCIHQHQVIKASE